MLYSVNEIHLNMSFSAVYVNCPIQNTKTVLTRRDQLDLKRKIRESEEGEGGKVVKAKKLKRRKTRKSLKKGAEKHGISRRRKLLMVAKSGAEDVDIEVHKEKTKKKRKAVAIVEEPEEPEAKIPSKKAKGRPPKVAAKAKAKASPKGKAKAKAKAKATAKAAPKGKAKAKAKARARADAEVDGEAAPALSNVHASFMDVESAEGIKAAMVNFAGMARDPECTSKNKLKMKAELEDFKTVNLTHYWTRCSCGILRKADKKEVAYISATGFTKDATWAMKMFVNAKAAELIARCLDGLVADGILEEDYGEDCEQLLELRAVTREQSLVAIQELMQA